MERTNIKANPMNTTNNIIPATQCDGNVIESLKKYNQSQIGKMVCIETDTSTLDDGDDVVGETATHENDLPECAIAKTVVCFIRYLDIRCILCALFFHVITLPLEYSLPRFCVLRPRSLSIYLNSVKLNSI